MTYKAIFKGQLDFGTKRSYDQVFKMYEWRFENYYKNRVLLKTEEIFDPENQRLIIGKHIASNTNKKALNNTLALLDFASQFAVCGNIGVWSVAEESGRSKTEIIEPKGDKKTVMSYIAGCEHLYAENFQAAIEAFNHSIEKYDRHLYAYEKRGQAYYAIGDVEKAVSDFKKSIEIYAGNAKAHFGIAKILLEREKFEEAIPYLRNAISCAIPHEEEYWTARYLKGEAHFKLEQFDLSAREFKFFTRKKFAPGSKNDKLIKKAFVFYGQSLMEIKQYKEAYDVFHATTKIASLNDDDATPAMLKSFKQKAKAALKDTTKSRRKK